MALLDVELEFSDGQSLASKNSGTQTQSDDVLDLTGGNAGKDGWGTTIAERLESGALQLTAQVGTVLVGASAAVVCQVFVHSAATSIASGTVLAELTIPALSAAGWKNTISMPSHRLATTDRYLGIVCKVSGGNVTTGVVEAFLTLGPPDSQI